MSRPSGRWLRRLAWLALVVVAVNLLANLARQARSRRRPLPPPTPISEAAAVEVQPEPPAPAEQPDGATEPAAWVAPVDKTCPEGYPVKAKVASGVYHVPGGLSYARTVPDRCYASPQQAEADGFRPAKR